MPSRLDDIPVGIFEINAIAGLPELFSVDTVHGDIEGTNALERVEIRLAAKNPSRNRIGSHVQSKLRYITVEHKCSWLGSAKHV